MANPDFRKPLPEDRLSEKERDDRISIFDQFSKKLKKEMRTAGFEDKSVLRQLLRYAGIRLKLLDLENRHARGIAQYDFLLGASAKPVSQGLIGVTADALLKRGIESREKMIRRHEEQTEPLMQEVSLLAPEIDRLLDQRKALDKDNYVLRPSSCLPEVAVTDEDASSKSASANAENPGPKPTRKPRKKGVWLDPENTKIMVGGNTYWRNHMANKIMQVKGLTERQCEAAVLSLGYQMGDEYASKMGDAEIKILMGLDRKTILDHRKAAEAKMRQDPVMRLLLNSLNNRKSKIEQSEDDED